MKLEVNIAKKHFFILLGAILFLVIVIGVSAYNSGSTPNVVGHSAEELEGVCKTGGGGCPDGFGYGSFALHIDTLCSGNFFIPNDGAYIILGKAVQELGDMNWDFFLSIDNNPPIDQSQGGDYVVDGGVGGGKGTVPLMGYPTLTKGDHNFKIESKREWGDQALVNPMYCDIIILGPFS